jgi:glycosyltransferase involved in cell wall biosynthesis/thioredoxin-like negative regulator of GroEL
MIDPRAPEFSFTPVAAGRPRFTYEPALAGEEPRVSIITPFFNTGDVFHESVASVLHQSFQQWEWVIVNDGSEDPGALRMLDAYRHADKRIRVIDNMVNQGPGASRNIGVRAARSPFVVLLDSDDLLEPTAIEKWFWHLSTFPGHAFVKGFGVGFGALEYLWTRGFHEGAAFLEEHLVDVTSMVRRDVHAAVGGFDEETRDGLEDWEFWLRCAARGYWGATIPEFHNWYRRRADHTDRWHDLSGAQRDAFRNVLRRRYPELWEGKFPKIAIPSIASADMPEDIPASNILKKSGRRLLLVLPWLAMGGADKFNLDVVKELTRRGWEVSIATTREGDYSWLPVFARATPDVFPLPNFLRIEDYPRFLSYLITSRQTDVVLISNSEFGYKVLPWLRSRHPEVTFTDYCHMEEEGWYSGGYPRMAVQYQEQLDLNIVSSEYLKGWMTRHGGDPTRIEVCTTNIDIRYWCPDPDLRKRERVALGVPEDLPVILYPCRIAAQKQPAVFLETMHSLREHQQVFVALVAGDGPDLSPMKKVAGEYALGDSVRFLGAVSNERVHDLMAAADILFLPSKWEGIALTLYEAMASGVAVVGAAVGGQSELAIPGTGMLIAPSTPEVEAREYTQILLKLLENPAAVTQLQEAARERVVTHFGIEHMGDRMASLCEHALRCHTSTPRPNVSIGLGRSTAIEALEMQRNQPQRLWYAGISDAATTILQAVQGYVAAGEYAIAAGLLEPLRRVFVGAKDAERVTMIDAQIERVRAMQAAVCPAPAPGENDPMVSVVIPCYGQAEFLPDAMQSVLVQTHRFWEMIVVNDGSPDNTSDVVRDFQRRYPDFSIRLIEQVNGGLSAARNAGFAAARGAFVVPLDADDRIAPAFIARCLEEAKKNEKLGFVYTNLRHFGELHDVFELPPFDPNTFIHKDNTATCCALIRHAMWKEVGGYNEQMREGYEDWDFWVGAIEKGWAGLRIPEPLFEYRIKHRSMLRDANARRPYLIARIVLNHPALYDDETRQWAEGLVKKNGVMTPLTMVPRSLRVCYLIHNLLGVTGGNQTVLQQANALVARGHEVTIVSYSEPPSWMSLAARVVRVHPGMPMARLVPPSDVVIATYFLNALELTNIEAPVKVYFAQGDQFVFAESGDAPSSQKLQRMSVASYGLPGVHVVANSGALARRISAIAGQSVREILPVCVDRRVFHPVQRSTPVPPYRILVVGPDEVGTETEPLAFKGIGDIREAMEILLTEGIQFTVVRISNTAQEIFREFPCEFHRTPDEDTKTRLYLTADLLVYASHYDSCPRPPLEAMAAGVPVVCTNTEGALEYCVDGKNALLVPVQSPSKIAAAVRQVLGDRELYERLVKGGLATADMRPVEREWDRLEKMLKEMVGKENDSTHRREDPAPSLSIVALLSSSTQPEAQRFVAEVEAGVTGSHELILVAHSADEQARSWLASLHPEGNLKSVLLSGGNYAMACNGGLRIARGEHICIVKDGFHMPPNWCDALERVLREKPAVAMVAPAVVRESDGSIELQGQSVGSRSRCFPLRVMPTHCMMFRSSLLGWAGVMNESAGPSDEEPAGFVYRTMLTGSEAVTAADIIFRCNGDEGSYREAIRPFCLSKVSSSTRSDRIELMKRAVLVALEEARTLEYRGRSDEAARRLEEELKHFPESPALRSALAWLLVRCRRFDDASVLIGQTPDSVKRHPVWLLIAGYTMEGLGEFRLARQCADKALEIDPHSAPALLLSGIIFLDEGDEPSAIAQFADAIQTDPDFGEAYAQRGALLWVYGNKDGARADLERAFMLNPDNTEIIDGFLQTCEDETALSGAARLVCQARKFFPDQRRLAGWHLTILTALERNDEAASEAARALARFGPEDDLLDAAVRLRQSIGPRSTAKGHGVTLCMIARNEERDLARCLGSVEGLVDEIVVVDTGSTDRTSMIATAMGARVVKYEWNDDFAEARNAGLSQARGAWILVLDADEVLSPDDAVVLRQQLLGPDARKAGIVFTTRNYVMEMDHQGWWRNDGRYIEEAGTGWIGSDKVRLFPNRPEIRFHHAVHEIVEESLMQAGLPLIRTEIPVHHYGRLDAARTRRKAEQYVAIGRKKLAAGSLGDSRAILELAAQEQELGNHGEAVPLWKRFLDLHPGDARAELGLGVSLFALDRWGEARAVLAQLIAHDSTLREGPVKYALTALQCGDSPEALRVLNAFTARHPDYPFGRLALAASLACENRQNEAREQIQAVEQLHIRSEGFFVNLRDDLRRGRQVLYADRVAACYPLHENPSHE